MDFSTVDLTAEEQRFQADTRALLSALVTPEVRRRDRDSGDNFDETVHLALGERGYLGGDLQPESAGGFDPVRWRIWELETQRVQMPYFHWDITQLAARAVQEFASRDVQDEV